MLATKETSLTIVGNAKTDAFPSSDLQLALLKVARSWDPKSREERVDSLTKFIYLRLKTSTQASGLAGPHAEKMK